ncbi:hypothetical protein TL16_g10812 [Triparma laevis f. inornata]|uniref:Uncharacterized protein n=1 Tax=Triparma laevis f. inornata TaxID=1714386 RepID=A0A9W7BII6_9STRA|nr:hypothetical protein TL16_g10812 [Triparma laevis f. inornata]
MTITNSISGLVPKNFKHAKKYVSVTKLALVGGAGLSFVDLICDLIMVNEYTELNEQGYANATIAAVGLSLVLQLIVVLVSNSKLAKSRILLEMLYVVTFVKPGVDVYRVSTGKKAATGSRSNPYNEMIYVRAIELFAECILIIVISIFQLISFGLFLFLMNPSYRSIFSSPKTGSQEACISFKNAENDHARFNVLKLEKTLWRPIEEDIRKWINGNLEGWLKLEDEGGEEFSNNKKALILDELVEDKGLLTRIM